MPITEFEFDHIHKFIIQSWKIQEYEAPAVTFHFADVQLHTFQNIFGFSTVKNDFTPSCLCDSQNCLKHSSILCSHL